jgi:hypothetical protein
LEIFYDCENQFCKKEEKNEMKIIYDNEKRSDLLRLDESPKSRNQISKKKLSQKKIQIEKNLGRNE